MSNLRVLIVGASVAGPTAAYWFARAGASVTVIERFPTLRTGGQGIDIRTAGVTVMSVYPKPGSGCPEFPIYRLYDTGLED
jgi:2-polyprenyl-6-methoxyphenol hydroxylase-like FAD-dependent oxidoreductase